MADPGKPKRAASQFKRAEPDPLPVFGNPPRRTSPQSAPADKSESGNERPGCDSRCERFAACRPDAPGWVLKKEAAAHLKTTLSALKQRALRVGYTSNNRRAMPRGDQPKLCFDAAYFILCGQLKTKRRG